MDGKRAHGERSGDSLRIALVTETYPPEVNGVAHTLARLVDGLCRRGHRVQLIRPRQSRQDQPTRSPCLCEVLTAGLPIPGYPGLRFGLAARRQLMRTWANDPPDIVHVATEGPLGMTAVAAARRLGLAVSSGYHTNFQSYSRHYRIGWLYGFVSAHLRRFHNRTDLTLVPTREVATRLADEGYRNVDVLARGVDTELFNARRRSTGLRQSWGADDDTLVVAYVGRLAPEKNLSLVTRTFEAIRRRHRNVRLLFVGDGPSSTSLKRRHPDCIFAGVRHGTDLATHYASADLFLFPSLTETYGNVIPEALACGLAVVAFDCAAAADLIQDGVNGRTVAPPDETAFIDAGLALAGDREHLTRLRRCAPGSIAHLDWESVQDGFAERLATLNASRTRRMGDESRIALASN